jgi:hypothetical protein
MTERRRRNETAPRSGARRPPIDEELLARAAEINEAVAGEFAEKAVSPLDNPLIERLAQLGVETDAAVSVALQRAHRIAFYMRRGRTPRDAAELSDDARELSGDERAQVAALAVSWWDGVLTALRARELEPRDNER